MTREMITIISLLTSAPKLTDIILSSQLHPLVTFDHLQVQTDEMTLTLSLQSEHLRHARAAEYLDRKHVDKDRSQGIVS